MVAEEEAFSQFVGNAVVVDSSVFANVSDCVLAMDRTKAHQIRAGLFVCQEKLLSS